MSVRYTSHSNRAKAVPVSITGAAAPAAPVETLFVDQTTGGGVWQD